MTPATLLLLNDGRFPSGGHAHSGGLEAAIASGLVVSAVELQQWLLGRLHTSGRVDAAFAVFAWQVAATDQESTARTSSWLAVVAEYWARTPSAALRATSRAQGRGLNRALRSTWPSDEVEQLNAACPGGPPWAVLFGAGARGAGLSAEQTAVSVATASVHGPAWAATRLLGMDPYAVISCLAALATEVEQVAEDSLEFATAAFTPADLPAASAPLLDIGAEDHSRWEVRLFAS